MRQKIVEAAYTEKAVADAIVLSNEKYCSVAATVRPTAEITTSYEVIGKMLG